MSSQLRKEGNGCICPFCGHTYSAVMDSRHLKERMAIRRRRRCKECHMRFTTYEIYEHTLETFEKAHADLESMRSLLVPSGRKHKGELRVTPV